jgi:capsular polysaccharide biosynthesis protein
MVVNILKKMIPLGYRRATSRKTRNLLQHWIFEKLNFNLVTREELFKNCEKYHFLQFGSAESLRVSQPWNGADALPNAVKKAIGTHTLQQPFVSEVENAQLFGSTAVGFDENGSLISDTVMPTIANPEKYLPKRIPIQTLVCKKLPNFGSPQVDTACSLVNYWSKAYFHWIMDCLLRLEGLEYYQEQTGKKPVLIIDAHPTNWQKESLRLLGYEPDDCILWNGSQLRVKRLVVPSFRREQKFSISPAACRWLRQRILRNLSDTKNNQQSFSPRIYITRAAAVGRQIINEDEVLAALTPLGFVAYTLESMSFAEQVRLFSQAEIVVAPHGAGLANIIFAQNLNVIELFGSIGTPSYLVLANALGFRYSCLTSNPDSSKHPYIAKYDNVTVDIDKLQALIADISCVSSDRQPASTIC